MLQVFCYLKKFLICLSISLRVMSDRFCLWLLDFGSCSPLKAPHTFFAGATCCSRGSLISSTARPRLLLAHQVVVTLGGAQRRRQGIRCRRRQGRLHVVGLRFSGRAGGLRGNHGRLASACLVHDDLRSRRHAKLRGAGISGCTVGRLQGAVGAVPSVRSGGLANAPGLLAAASRDKQGPEGDPQDHRQAESRCNGAIECPG